MAEKMANGEIAKFINDNTLLNQVWIMDPKKKVLIYLKNQLIKILKY